MQRRVDVFPAPFGPMRPTTSPGATLNDKSSTAVNVSYIFERCATAITARYFLTFAPASSAIADSVACAALSPSMKSLSENVA